MRGRRPSPTPMFGEEEPFANMTRGVIGSTYEMLRSTLGREWDMLLLSIGSVILYKLSKTVQRMIEDLIFVQILVGCTDDDDEEDADLHEMDVYGNPTGGGDAEKKKKQAEAREEMAECVRAYASHKIFASRSWFALFFPLPELLVSTAIDSSTYNADGQLESRELNKASEGVPLKTATLVPAAGESSVIIVDGVSLLRLPFVWISEGTSNESIADKLKRALPERIADGIQRIFERYTSGGGGGMMMGGYGGPRGGMGMGMGGGRMAHPGMMMGMAPPPHPGSRRGPGGRRGMRGGGAGPLGSLGNADSAGPQGSLLMSTFVWNEKLLTRVLDEARALSHQKRARRCRVLKLGLKSGAEIRRSHHRAPSGDRDEASMIPIHNTVTPDGGCLVWDVFDAPPRKMSSVFVAPQIEMSLLRSIDAFLKRRKWFVRRGFKYQTVYLLHGPPGNGKSSVMQALAAFYTMPLFVVQLSGGNVTKSDLRQALNHTAKAPCIVAVEDAESCFVEEQHDDSGDDDEEDGGLDPYGGGMAAPSPFGGGGLFGAPANLFGAAPYTGTGRRKGRRGGAPMMHPGRPHADEGAVTAREFVSLLKDESEENPSGRIIILTTNTEHKMDPSLRAFINEDGTRVEFPAASLEVMERVWRNFYGSDADGAFGKFASAYTSEGASNPAVKALELGISAFQGYLMQHRDAPEGAADAGNVSAFLRGLADQQSKREERGETPQEESVTAGLEVRRIPTGQAGKSAISRQASWVGVALPAEDEEELLESSLASLNTSSSSLDMASSTSSPNTPGLRGAGMGAWPAPPKLTRRYTEPIKQHVHAATIREEDEAAKGPAKPNDDGEQPPAPKPSRSRSGKF